MSTFLIQQTGSNLAPGVYAAVATIVVLPIVIFGIPETFRQPLGGEAGAKEGAAYSLSRSGE